MIQKQAGGPHTNKLVEFLRPTETLEVRLKGGTLAEVSLDQRLQTDTRLDAHSFMCICSPHAGAHGADWMVEELPCGLHLLLLQCEQEHLTAVTLGG